MGFWGIVDEKLELHSPLAREECLKRFKNSLGSVWDFYGSRGVVGWVLGSSVRARIRSRGVRSFRTIIRVRMKDEIGGTHLKCRFGLSTLDRAFLILAMLIILPLLFGEVGNILRGETPAGILAPLAFLAWLFALVAVCRWFTGDDEGELITFVRRTVDAKFAEDRVQR